MYRVINTAENFGRDAWFVNESDREFETLADAEAAAKHLNNEYETNTFETEEYGD